MLKQQVLRFPRACILMNAYSILFVVLKLLMSLMFVIIILIILYNLYEFRKYDLLAVVSSQIVAQLNQRPLSLNNIRIQQF
jgi:hypothetical protein